MFLLSYFIVSIVVIQGVSSLQCYGLSNANNTSVIGIQDSTVLSGICTNSSCACVSYMFQCLSNNTLCSTQQQQSQAIIWNYALVSNSTCQQLISGGAMNITCCYTNLCNTQGMSATSTSMIGMTTTSSQNSTSLLSFSIWIVLLALCFCV